MFARFWTRVDLLYQCHIIFPSFCLCDSFISGFGQGTPEQWMYSKLREKLLSGLAVSSIPLLELVKIFVFEFPVIVTIYSNKYNINDKYKIINL